MRLHNSVIACLFLGISAKTGGGKCWWCWRWRREESALEHEADLLKQTGLEWEYLFQMTAMTLECRAV